MTSNTSKHTSTPHSIDANVETQLPDFDTMTQQLYEGGVLDDDDLQAFERHLPRTMNGTMNRTMDRTMTMTMTMARRLVLEADDDDQENYVDMPRVRTHVGWRDLVYVAMFLKLPEVELPFPGQTTLNNTAALYVPPYPDEAGTQNELNELFWMQEHPEREQRVQDIIEEENDYTTRFMYALGIDPHVHAQTLRLIDTLGFLAEFIVMPWKLHYHRPRPSQRDKDLEPTILVPAHYAYPSGHATQVHLVARALNAVINAERDIIPQANIEFIADEVSANREWAGVHYRSDSEAGKALAEKIWALGESNQTFKELMDRAREEWL